MAHKATKKTAKTPVPAIYSSVEQWIEAAVNRIRAVIAAQTAPEEGTTPKGKGKPALTVPADLFVSIGFPSTQAFADVKAGEGARFAKKRGELWEPNQTAIGRQRLIDAPITTKDADQADKMTEETGKTVNVTDLVHGPRVLTPEGKQAKTWALFLSPRLGAGMAPGDREVTILATMLHYLILAALGPAVLVMYDPKKQPKAFARAPKGRTERYGERWQTAAKLLGFTQPQKRENFDLDADMTETLRALVYGSAEFPEPLGVCPAPVVAGFTMKRIGADVRDFPRLRTFQCPLYDKKDKANTHTTFTASDKYAPDVVDPITNIVSSVLADFAPVCGKIDCQKPLNVIQPPQLRLYNEAVKRGIPVTRALLIASGEIPPPWKDQPGEATEAEAETDQSDDSADAAPQTGTNG
jgi:hypothetical protein